MQKKTIANEEYGSGQYTDKVFFSKFLLKMWKNLKLKNPFFEGGVKFDPPLVLKELKVNPVKSELFLVNPESNLCITTPESFNDVMDGIKIIQKSDLTLLGAPIYVNSVDKVLDEKINNLKTMSERLKQQGSERLPEWLSLWTRNEILYDKSSSAEFVFRLCLQSLLT